MQGGSFDPNGTEKSPEEFYKMFDTPKCIGHVKMCYFCEPYKKFCGVLQVPCKDAYQVYLHQRQHKGHYNGIWVCTAIHGTKRCHEVLDHSEDFRECKK